MRRRKHHLRPEVFLEKPYVVSLTFCTADRDPWLVQPKPAEIVRQAVLRLDDPHVRVLGYCLMPDHVHLVAASSGPKPGRIAGVVKGRSARFMRVEKPGLNVWQRGYHDHVVRRSEGLYATLRHIFMNPVRKGLVDRWWDFPWTGSPVLGPLGPDTWSAAPPEDLLWSDLLQVAEPPEARG